MEKSLELEVKGQNFCETELELVDLSLLNLLGPMSRLTPVHKFKARLERLTVSK